MKSRVVVGSRVLGCPDEECEHCAEHQGLVSSWGARNLGEESGTQLSERQMGVVIWGGEQCRLSEGHSVAVEVESKPSNLSCKFSIAVGGLSLTAFPGFLPS